MNGPASQHRVEPVLEASTEDGFTVIRFNLILNKIQLQKNRCSSCSKRFHIRECDEVDDMSKVITTARKQL